jgi:predicted transposase YdaD
MLDLDNWGEGVYLMSDHLKTGIIVLHQLPKTPETLWLRILGKGRVQEQAIQEVAALPAQHPQRDNVLDLLGNLKVILEARANIEPEEQELIMQLSPLYLEKIQAAELVGEQRGEIRGEQRGEVKGKNQGRVEEAKALVIRQLTRKLGTVHSPLLEEILALPLERVELLGEDLLDFTSIDNLEQWLNQN